MPSKFFNRYAPTVRPIADSLCSIPRLGSRPAVETSEDAFASAVIREAASRMKRAFITLRKPDESIKHDSKDQEPKLYERGKEIVHRRVVRRCDIKQPTFPEKVCTAY